MEDNVLNALGQPIPQKNLGERITDAATTPLAQLLANKLYQATGTHPGQFGVANPLFGLGGTAEGTGAGQGEGPTNFNERLKLAQFQQGQQEARRKFNKPFLEGISKGSQAEREALGHLGRMEQLNEEGKLHGPLINKFLDYWGLQKNAKSQEFEKETLAFLNKARDLFGARVTQYEVRLLMNSIPTLKNTQEGRRQIINNMKILNQAAGLKERAAQMIIAQNGGTPPFDLQQQVEQATGPLLDDIYTQFAAGVQHGNQLQNTFDKMPNAAKFKGKRGVDDSGQEWLSNGKTWEKV